MAVLVQGHVRDRPWGQTLGALGLRGLSGQLVLHADDKDYGIAFENGTVVGAWSPNTADSAPRIALTNHLVSSSAVPAIQRRILAQPDRDEVDIVAELARLTPEQADVLRVKLIGQRAARTFAIDAGEFTVEDQITIPRMPAPGLDIRAVVYLGARLNLSEERLSKGLRNYGTYFQLRPEAKDTLDRYGFSEAEATVLVELTAGTSLHELEAIHRELDPRMVQAIVYALFSCQACQISDAPAMPRAATVQKVQSSPTNPPPLGEAAAYSVPASEHDVSPRTISGNRQPISVPLDFDSALVTPPPPEPPRTTTDNPFPVRAPTPPVTGRTPAINSRTSTENPFPARAPTPGFERRQGTPGFEKRQVTPGFDKRTPTPPFEARTPTPSTARVPTENPFPMRTPTPPFEARTQTDNPFPIRQPTPPVTGRTPSYRGPVNGPDEAGVPRNRGGSTPPANKPASSRPGTESTRAPTDAPAARIRPGGAPRAPTEQPAVARAPTANPPAVSRTATSRKTAALIAARVILLDQGADYFSLLGVPFEASVEVVRTAYLQLVRQLHPDKLSELQVDDPSGNATRLFAAMGNAFTVLTDPQKRAQYMSALGQPGAPRTKTGEEVAATPAVEAYRRGESALRRDEPYEAVEHFTRAVELSPQDVDYAAMLGWARFCASPDKPKAAVETRKLIDRAIKGSPKPHNARFLLGRVERMLGRDKEALRQFETVLEDVPSHAEARAEIRAIETRLSGSAGRKR